MIITGSKEGYTGWTPAHQKADKAERTAGRDFSKELLAAAGQTETEDMLQLLRDRKEEILVKVQKGETEPKIRIGAQAYTQKEWKKLLEAFDGAEDKKKELLEKMRERSLQQAQASDNEK